MKKYNVSVPQEQEDDYELPMEYMTSNSADEKSSMDLKKRRIVNEGDEANRMMKKKKKDKERKKEKKEEKKKEKKKLKADEKNKKERGEESSTSSSGTKKKSSIFGGVTVPNAVVPKAFTDVNGKKETTAAVNKKKKNRHVCFSDDVSIIPRSEEPEIKVTRSLSSVLKEKKSSMKDTKAFSPPPVNGSDDEDDEDDYTPSISSSSLMKTGRSSSNNRIISNQQNFDASIYDDPQSTQTKRLQLPATVAQHANLKTHAPTSTPGVLSASDYGEPDRRGENVPNRCNSQHASNENQKIVAPAGSEVPSGPSLTHFQMSPSSGPENPYSQNSLLEQQRSTPKMPGGGPAGARNSSRRNASSSPFIPRKRKPRP